MIKNHSQLIQAILTFIITNIINHDEIKELENLFKKLDTNQDGKLSKEELVEAYKHVYTHLDEKAVQSMVDNIIQNTDFNFSGQIDYTEYLVAAINKDKLLTRDKLTKAFQSFDLVVFPNYRTAMVSLQKKNGKNVLGIRSFQPKTGQLSLRK